VDHTKLDLVADKGKKAIGPVGRKRWYAVVFVFGGNGEWTRVLTRARVG
jgi:hypothetical protein